MRRPSKSEIDSFVNLTHSKIARWTTNELLAIQESSIAPICIKINDTKYRVSNFDIENVGLYWVAAGHIFNDLRNAVLYCSLIHIGRFTIADELLSLNNQIRDLSFDKDLFQSRVNSAHESGNQFNIDLFTSRHKEVREKLSYSKQRLRNIISQQLRFVTTIT